MSITINPPMAGSRGVVGVRSAAIPLYIYAVSLAAFLTVVGVLWDISWHRSIGRDKFLSPPHILIYLGAIFAGLFSGMQVLYNSIFRRDVARRTMIRVWGIFYSSLGGLFCIWGAIAMLTSAPFDDWWHNAYGLDVKILSPPHTLLAMGMICLQLGACVCICKYLNAAGAVSSESAPADGPDAVRRAVLKFLFILSACSLLTMVYTLGTEFLHVRGMRGGLFYIIAAFTSLLLLPAFGKALRMRWGMTSIGLGYFLLVAISNWTLQLFPAEPKLGPILTHITYFQPAEFPALVFLPGLVMDLFTQHSRPKDWDTPMWLSLIFTLVLFAVQYPLSGFLLESPASRNWFFGGDTWYYGNPPNPPFRHRFRPDEVASAATMGIDLVLAALVGWGCAGLSLRWGKWMQTIQR